MEPQEMLPEILFLVRQFRAVCDSELCRAVLAWKEMGETAEDSDLLLLLRLGGNVNCRVINQDFPEGESPPILYFAISNGLDGAARMLIRFGARLGPYPELQAPLLGGTALHVACRTGSVLTVQALLGMGADVTAVDRDGNTALHCASQFRHLRVATLLLEARANVHVANHEGSTVLCVAAGEEGAEVVKILLKAGATVNAAYRNGKTALFLACQNGQDRFLSTPWSHYASAARKWAATEVVRSLLEAGADVGLPANRRRFMPLHIASWSGHPEIVTLLLGANADVNARDSEGLTPLEIASLGGNLQTSSWKQGLRSERLCM